MIDFHRLLYKDIYKIQNYTKKSKYPFCDYSGGVIFTWYLGYKVEYAIYNDTLILKIGEPARFLLPLGKDFYGAITEIENYCIENGFPINFACVDEKNLEFLKGKYNDNIIVSYNRDFSDYVYDYQEMKTFSGKKFNGQRNHINAFKKLYPNYQYKKIDGKDEKRIYEFLEEYQKEHKKTSVIEEKELKYTKKIISYIKKGCFFGGYLEVDKKIVAISVGEYVGDMLVIHVEKALTKYKGVYPTMYNEFVKHSEKEGITKVNREDDSGDMGLRISKTQYKPINICNKYYIQVKSVMPNVKKPKLKKDGVYLNGIRRSDIKSYAKLYKDKEINKWWGYDYKKDIKDKNEKSFYLLQLNDYRKRYNMCLAIRKSLKGELIGEVILYNFKHDNSVEIGIRLFKEYHKKGIARKSLEAVLEYIKNQLKLTAKMKCFKENLASKNLIEKCNFVKINEDEKYLYYEKK